MKNAEVVKYSLLQQIRYLSNYSRLVIHLHRTLDSLELAGTIQLSTLS